jgi:peptide/nickel transport system substrate-binding protein
MRLIAFSFAGLLAMSAAFGQDGPPGVEPGNDWLVIRYPTEPPNLNPIIHRDVYGAWILYYLNCNLLMLDKEKAQLKPELLAEMPTVSADKLTYTLKLRKDARWHDGKPVTSQDVKFSFDMMMNDKVDAERTRSYYEDVKSVEVPDDHTIKFTYKKPYYFTLYSFYDFPVVPKHAFTTLKDPAEFNTHPYNDNPIGCGPYKLEKWEKGVQIVLVRNEDYFGPKPNLKKIVLKFIQDDTAAVAELKRGAIDVMALPPARWEKDLKADKDILGSYPRSRATARSTSTPAGIRARSSSRTSASARR